jgi:hypothetical protein
VLGDRVHVQEPKHQQHDRDHADQTEHDQGQRPDSIGREVPLAIRQPPARRDTESGLVTISTGILRAAIMTPVSVISTPPRLWLRDGIDEDQPPGEVARPPSFQDSRTCERSRSPPARCSLKAPMRTDRLWLAGVRVGHDGGLPSPWGHGPLLRVLAVGPRCPMLSSERNQKPWVLTERLAHELRSPNRHGGHCSGTCSPDAYQQASRASAGSRQSVPPRPGEPRRRSCFRACASAPHSTRAASTAA